MAMGVFGASSVQYPRYGAGADWVGVMVAIYNGVARLCAFVLPRLFDRRYGVIADHAGALMVGGAGYPAWRLSERPRR